MSFCIDTVCVSTDRYVKSYLLFLAQARAKVLTWTETSGHSVTEVRNGVPAPLIIPFISTEF